MKICFKCGVEKPLTEFYRHPQTNDGYLGKCKDCTRRDVKMNYRARLDQYHAYERARFQQPERKARVYAQSAKHQKLNPDKTRARRAIYRSIRRGVIERQPCEFCGTTVKVEAHHHDYSKPLDVRWLCRRHHRQVEGRLVNASLF